MHYWSAATGGFYQCQYHGARYIDDVPNPDTKIPPEAVEISEEHYQQLIDGLSKGKRVQADETGMPVLVDKPPETLDELAARKRRELDRARDDAINAGFAHTFGDASDIVQTRQRDRENLTGLAVSAQRHPEEIFYFRAQSNATYQLTAEEMLALADAAQTHASQQYAYSWQLKAEIDAAHKAEDREAIEAITW